MSLNPITYHFYTTEEQIPNSKAVGYVLINVKTEKTEKTNTPLSSDRTDCEKIAFVYITKIALTAINNGEIVVRPVQTFDNECYDNGPIMNESRLGAIKFYDNGSVTLALRSPLVQPIQQNSNEVSVKLQNWIGREISIEILDIKVIEGMPEHEYRLLAKLYLDILKRAYAFQKKFYEEQNKTSESKPLLPKEKQASTGCCVIC